MNRFQRMLTAVLACVLLLSAGPIEVLQLSLSPQRVQSWLKSLGGGCSPGPGARTHPE